jgi:hypothetical protein
MKGSVQAEDTPPTAAVPRRFEATGAGPHIVDRGFIGFDAAARAELRFPPAPTVTIRVVHFSNPGRVEAFEPNGSVADMKQMAPMPAVEQSFTLNGRAIDRVVVTPASPSDETRVLELCNDCPARRRALDLEPRYSDAGVTASADPRGEPRG